MMSCIINASSWREPANCSIQSFLCRTTFSNDHLQMAENTENDQKFESSKQKCDRPSPWKTVNMKKTIALFSVLAIKNLIGRWFQKRENQLIFQIRSRDWETGPKSGDSQFMVESWQVWAYAKVCCHVMWLYRTFLSVLENIISLVLIYWLWFTFLLARFEFAISQCWNFVIVGRSFSLLIPLYQPPGCRLLNHRVNILKFQTSKKKELCKFILLPTIEAKGSNKFCIGRQFNLTENLHKMGRVKRTWYLSPMWAVKVQASLHIHAVSPEPPLLTHTSSESRGKPGPRPLWMAGHVQLKFVMTECSKTNLLDAPLILERFFRKCHNQKITASLGSSERERRRLTHICLVDPSILINWMSPFPILGVSGVLFHF